MRFRIALLVASLAGCGPSAELCEGEACLCPAVADDGTCCNGFLELGDNGRCVARPWPPTERHELGTPGSYHVEIAVDGLGQSLVGWQKRATTASESRSQLAEQTSEGWRVHALGDPALGFGSQVTLASRGLEVWATWSQQRLNDDGKDESSVHLLRRDVAGSWSTPDTGTPLSFEPKAYQPQPLLPATGEGLVVWNQWREGGGYGVALARQAPDSDTLTRPDSASDVLSPPVFFSNAPQVAVGSNGDGIVTWYQATPPAGSTDTSTASDGLRIFVSERFRVTGDFSRPEVEDWISPEGPPVASHELRNPVVAVGSFGEALVFWSQEHPSGATGLYSATRDSSGRWSTPTDIDDTFGPLGTFATCIDVAITPSREAHVTWYDGAPGATVVYAGHRDPGGSWDIPQATPLSTPGVPALDPRLAFGPSGEAVVVWSERDAGQWRVMGRRRAAHATAWGNAVEISDPSEGDALEPAVAIGPDRTIAIAWTAGPLGAQTIRVATLP